MQTHDDQEHETRDATKALDTQMKALKEKADQMTADGSNTITAGSPGERAEEETLVPQMMITKMPDDPHGVLRISIGGNKTLGYYLTYRGDQTDIDFLLARAQLALNGSL